MIAELRIRTGGLAGHVRSFSPGHVRVGRGDDADLRFDPVADLEVSARHAVLSFEQGAWLVRDLDSRNGTFVNGARVIAPTPLRDGDEIRFGPGGPAVEFRTNTVRDQRPGPGRSRLRMVAGAGTAAAVVLLLVLGAGLRMQSAREQAAFEQERNALLSRIDTLIAASEADAASLADERTDVADAFREVRDNARAARDQARGGGNEPREETELLLRRLQQAETALARQQLAATLDVDAVTARLRYAVALLYVEDAQGVTRTGTGFAVSSDGTIVTARHLVEPAGSAGVRRVAVQFAYSDQVWPARILTTSDDHDIAVVRVDGIAGGVPIVASLVADGATDAGHPVALVGFPLGGAEPAGDRASLARPVISVGVVMAAGPDRLDVQGYGASGASGSPITDASGQVVGVLYGGRRDAEARVLVAVPAARVVELLSRVR